jgi:hypothetical protein
VTVVAAGNPPEQAADGWDLSPPLANRFCHLEWEVDPRAVAQGFVAGFAPVTIPDAAPGWQASGVATASGIVGGFLIARPELTCAVPKDASRAGRGWPSPRSWEMVARVLAAWKATGMRDDVLAALCVGCVGDGAGQEFFAFHTELDLPDPEMVLADPGSFRVPQRSDRALAALSAVCAVVVADLTIARWLAAWRVLGRAAQTVPDVAAVAARSLTTHRPPDAPVPPEVHEFFAPILREAGLA